MTRTLNFGASEDDANYQITEDGDGNLVINDVSGASPTALLRYDTANGEWDLLAPLNADSNNIASIGDLSATTASVSTAPSSSDDVARQAELDGKSDTGHDHTEADETTISEAGLDSADIVVERPERQPIAALDDGESIEVPVYVPDQSTVEVYRWGAVDLSDESSPSGLTVELLDGTDTVQASASTANAQDKTSPLASHQNTTGSASWYKLRALNSTGAAINSPGVGCHFGYLVV